MRTSARRWFEQGARRSPLTPRRADVSPMVRSPQAADVRAHVLDQEAITRRWSVSYERCEQGEKSGIHHGSLTQRRTRECHHREAHNARPAHGPVRAPDFLVNSRLGPSAGAGRPPATLAGRGYQCASIEPSQHLAPAGRSFRPAIWRALPSPFRPARRAAGRV